MKPEEAIIHLFNDWYKLPEGKICIDAEKADLFLEAIGIGVNAINDKNKLSQQINTIYFPCDGCYYQTHGSFGKCFSCIREKTDNYTLNGPKIKEE